MSALYTFFSGAAMMGALVSALFFLRFWSKTQDRLFLIFSLAFVLMGVERMALALQEHDGESNVMLYCLRLASFLMILYGIWDKNRPQR